MPSPDAHPLTRAVLVQLEAELAAQQYSLSSMARAIDVDRNTLRRYVKGEREMPLPILETMLRQLELDPAVFMSRARNRIAP